MKKLKAFFTDPLYRWGVLGLVKVKLLSLPGIRHVCNWIFAYKFSQSLKGKSRWEQYVVCKKMEDEAEKVKFIGAIARLLSVIMIDEKTEKDLEKAKKDVLECEIIEEEEYREFKSWVEEIDVTETDCSRIMALLEKFGLEE